METEELFNKYVGFAYWIANKYVKSYPLEREDIQQQALLGLWIAAQRFDASKGFTFMTFANAVINNQILLYVRKLKRHIRTVSANKEIFENVETIPDTQYLDEVEIKMECNIILGKIKNERSQYIFKQIAIGRSQADIAKDLGISRSALSQLKFREAKKLQQKRGEILTCKTIKN